MSPRSSVRSFPLYSSHSSRPLLCICIHCLFSIASGNQSIQSYRNYSVQNFQIPLNNSQAFTLGKDISPIWQKAFYCLSKTLKIITSLLYMYVLYVQTFLRQFIMSVTSLIGTNQIHPKCFSFCQTLNFLPDFLFEVEIFSP